MISPVTQLRPTTCTLGGYGDEYEVPPGIYSACIIEARTALYCFGRAPKVDVYFRLLDPGPCFEKIVRCHYAVRELKGKPRKNGHFRVGPRSKLARHLSNALNSRPPLDHVPMTELERAILEIEVRLVTEVDRRPLALAAHYAVVDRIIRRLEG